MVMFDTLTRKFLPSYGCNWTKLPNFKRLEQHCTTFDNFYAGSLPCMPARRELHTGKHNFLHRSWGPLEPFDRSCVEVLRAEGVYTHLCTDHSHYWEDGGCTYHNRYDTMALMKGEQMVLDTDFLIAFAERMANAARCPVAREMPENMKEKLDIYLCRKRAPKQ